MRKWKCEVCGYIHTGDSPPDKCPVCGADKSRFTEITEAVQTPATAPAPKTKFETVIRLIVRHHVHPIATHIPNGVIPVSVLFIFLSALFNVEVLANAAYLNLVVVVLALPMVLFTGWSEWRNKYKSAVTTLFVVKIACALGVTVLAVISGAWLMIDPQVTASSDKWTFVLLNAALLGVTGIAGHIGGKLVFKD